MGYAETANSKPALQPKEGSTSEPSAGWSYLWKAGKLMLGAALVPACAGFSIGWYNYFFNLTNRLKIGMIGWPDEVRWLMGGVFTFSVLAIFLWRPVVIYVFAHEVVHAIAGWMCLARVSNLSASASGGQVTTSKTNTFIRLAPYFVPFYTLLGIGIFALADAFGRPLFGGGSDHHHALAWMLGFTMAFHVGFTLWSLRRDQPDLKPDGWLFSLVLIYIANIFVLSAVLGLALKCNYQGTWEAVQGVAQLGWQETCGAYHSVENVIRRAFNA